MKVRFGSEAVTPAGWLKSELSLGSVTAADGHKQTFHGEVRREFMGELDRMPDTGSSVLVEVGGPVDELSVCLAVYGEDLDPSDVTSLLGVEPTESFRRGYRRRPASKEMPHGAWFLQMRAVNHPDPGALIGALLSKVPDDAGTWCQLNDRYKVQLRIAIHMQDWNKGFGFDAKTASQLAAIGAEVVVDIYAYGEDETDEE